MKRSENGGSSSVRLTQTACAGGLLGQATSGTWMRYSSKSTDASITFGAVDQEGDVLNILVQTSRDKKAAKKFFRKLLKVRYVPRAIVTDKLRSDSAAKADCCPASSTAS
ncbi:hypothetical protein BH18ACI4_BH18ACI4_27780 [soil metagenome]